MGMMPISVEDDSYYTIQRMCDEERCGFGCFEILADRPLNHGHLIVCRVWCCQYRRGIWESEYRFIIDECGKGYILDFVDIRRGGGYGVRVRSKCGRAKLPFIPSEWTGVHG